MGIESGVFIVFSGVANPGIGCPQILAGHPPTQAAGKPGKPSILLVGACGSIPGDENFTGARRSNPCQVQRGPPLYYLNSTEY